MNIAEATAKTWAALERTGLTGHTSSVSTRPGGAPARLHLEHACTVAVVFLPGAPANAAVTLGADLSNHEPAAWQMDDSEPGRVTVSVYWELSAPVQRHLVLERVVRIEVDAADWATANGTTLADAALDLEKYGDSVFMAEALRKALGPPARNASVKVTTPVRGEDLESAAHVLHEETGGPRDPHWDELPLERRDATRAVVRRVLAAYDQV